MTTEKKPSAIEAWNRQAEAHHAQSIRARDALPPGEAPADFWQPLAANFRDDPRRTDDVVVNRLLTEVTPDTTVLDVGGGAGRLALPMALKCRHVTVVEPSDSMVAELRDGAKEACIKNLSVVQSNWEDAEVEPADLVLCSHVIYGIGDVEPFLRKLTDRARRRVLLLAFMEFPQARLSPFWKPIHGEERIDLPAVRELLPALWDMDVFPDVDMVEIGGAHRFDDHEAALGQLRFRLYVSPDSPADARLKDAMADLLVKTPDGLEIKGSPPRRHALVSWGPR